MLVHTDTVNYSHSETTCRLLRSNPNHFIWYTHLVVLVRQDFT